MHLPEGILSLPMIGVGTVAGAAGVAAGLWRLKEDRLPQAAMLSSAFFVISLVHVPLGPGSIHLCLGGLMGLLLGPASFPAMLVALGLQAVLFGHGGLTTLGANTLVMALPAAFVGAVITGPLRKASRRSTIAALGFAAGALATALSVGLFAALLLASYRELGRALAVFGAAQAALALVEGLITASALLFIRQVKPEMLYRRTRRSS